MGKEIQTGFISDDSGLPILKRTIDWIQESYNESIFQITKANFGYDDSNQGEVWQLSYMDIKNTSGTTWTWNAGSVCFGSKIYKTTAGTTTLGVGETLKWYYIETPQLGEPTLYEDLTSHNTNVEVKIGICKSTENISKQIQDVNVLRYMALDIVGSSGGLNFALVKRGKNHNLRVNGLTTGSDSIVLLKNYNGNTYNSSYTPPLILNFGYYDFADTTEFSRGSLHKNANNDLILNLGINNGTRVDFTVSWVQ